MKKVAIHIILSLFALSFLYPFVWMILASLTPSAMVSDLLLIPETLTFDNYRSLFSKIPIGRSFINSMFVALITTFSVIVFGSLVGYALAKMRFKGRQAIFFIIVFTMTLPFQITLIPNYITMVNLHLIDTYMALILPMMLTAFSILVFRQAFESLPNELINAARIDGCSQTRILFQILLPNIKSTVVVVGILSFMASWNDVLWPLIVIRQEELMTMPQMVTLFAVGGRAEAQLGVKLAAAVVLALPILIAYLFFQKHFIQSMASSGLK